MRNVNGRQFRIAGRLLLGTLVLGCTFSWSYPIHAQSVLAERTALEQRSTPAGSAPATSISPRIASPVAARAALAPAAGATSGSTSPPAPPSTGIAWGSPARAPTGNPLVKNSAGAPPFKAIAIGPQNSTTYSVGGIVPGAEVDCRAQMGVPCYCPANRPDMPHPAGCNYIVSGALYSCAQGLPLPCFCVPAKDPRYRQYLDPRGCTTATADNGPAVDGDPSQ
jgi:hypothetical protein